MNAHQLLQELDPIANESATAIAALRRRTTKARARVAVWEPKPCPQDWKHNSVSAVRQDAPFRCFP